MASSSSSTLFPAGDLFGPESVPPARRPVPTFEPWSERLAHTAVAPPSPVITSQPSSSSSSRHNHHHAAPASSSSSSSSSGVTPTAAASSGNPGIPGIPNLHDSMAELIRALSPMVEEWRQRDELELEARLTLVADVNTISETAFKLIVQHLFKTPKIHMKPGGTLTLPGIEEKIKFHGIIDQFYPLDGAGNRVRRSVDINGKTHELLQKIPQDTIDAIITPLPTTRYGRIPITAKHIAHGIDVRFSTKREKPVAEHQVPSAALSAMVNLRIKERVSFITEKGDFTIDCTRVRSGVSDEDAKAQKPIYEIEVEAIRQSSSMDIAGKTPLFFVNNFLYKCFSIIFGFTTTDASTRVLNVNMRSARGRAVTDHFSGPSAYGGVSGDTATMLEAKRAARHQAQAQRLAGAGLANTDEHAVDEALSSSSVVVTKARDQATHTVAMMAAHGVDVERTTSPMYPVAMMKKKDSVARLL